MTKKPVSIAEREPVQDISKVFDEQSYKASSFSNPDPYPLTAKHNPKSVDTLLREPIDTLTATTDKRHTMTKPKIGLAITPYPEANIKAKSKNAVKNSKTGDKSTKADANKWENAKTIVLITSIVLGINAISITLGYMNGEISGLGSIVGSGIMFFILFLIVLFSWFTMIFVRKAPIKNYYSRVDMKPNPEEGSQI